jgi:hypothetical protein
VAGWTITDPGVWADRQKANILDIRREIAFAIFARILYRTPVDSGSARQNWIVTLNAGSLAYNPSAAKGGMVLADGRKMIYNAKGDDTIIIQNNMPYIVKLEYGGYGPNSPSGKTVNGFSKQAPRGMVGITMQEFGGIVNEAVEKVR